MELTWLEDFLDLARSGNFSRSAEARHCTQPAFSRRIRALEDWAGVTLIDRATQPVTLTDAGRRFQPLAKTLMRDLTQARQEARLAASANSATLRFAATHALSLIFFSGWYNAVEHSAANWNVHLSSDGLAGCETLLTDGEVQFLLCHAHAAAPTRLPFGQFESVAVGADRLVPCITPQAFQFDSEKINTLETLPFLAYSQQSGLGRILSAALGANLPQNLNRPAMTADLAFLLKAMCLDGRGIAWLPHSLVDADIAAGRLTIVGPLSWQIPLEIRLFKSRMLDNAAANAFWKLISHKN